MNTVCLKKTFSSENKHTEVESVHLGIDLISIENPPVYLEFCFCFLSKWINWVLITSHTRVKSKSWDNSSQCLAFCLQETSEYLTKALGKYRNWVLIVFVLLSFFLNPNLEKSDSLEDWSCSWFCCLVPQVTQSLQCFPVCTFMTPAAWLWLRHGDTCQASQTGLGEQIEWFLRNQAWSVEHVQCNISLLVSNCL